MPTYLVVQECLTPIIYLTVLTVLTASKIYLLNCLICPCVLVLIVRI
jgi:hypothetical protein